MREYGLGYCKSLARSWQRLRRESAVRGSCRGRPAAAVVRPELCRSATSHTVAVEQQQDSGEHDDVEGCIILPRATTQPVRR